MRKQYYGWISIQIMTELTVKFTNQLFIWMQILGDSSLHTMKAEDDSYGFMCHDENMNITFSTWFFMRNRDTFKTLFTANLIFCNVWWKITDWNVTGIKKTLKNRLSVNNNLNLCLFLTQRIMWLENPDVMIYFNAPFCHWKSSCASWKKVRWVWNNMSLSKSFLERLIPLKKSR